MIGYWGVLERGDLFGTWWISGIIAVGRWARASCATWLVQIHGRPGDLRVGARDGVPLGYLEHVAVGQGGDVAEFFEEGFVGVGDGTGFSV
jgi:hypothetical protein